MSAMTSSRCLQARDGDVYLLCSDGLTTMIGEDEIAATLLAHERLRDAGEALIAAANQAGGRDDITVVLLRLGEVAAGNGAAARGGGRLDGGSPGGCRRGALAAAACGPGHLTPRSAPPR